MYKNNIPLEREEQEYLVKWLSYHRLLSNCIIKIDNEGKRSPLQGARLKRQGLHRGASDLFIAYPTDTFSGLFLEVKRNKSYSNSEKNSKTWLAQVEFQQNVKKLGYQACTCYGWIDGVKIIEDYLTS